MYLMKKKKNDLYNPFLCATEKIKQLQWTGDAAGGGTPLLRLPSRPSNSRSLGCRTRNSVDSSLASVCKPTRFSAHALTLTHLSLLSLLPPRNSARRWRPPAPTRLPPPLKWPACSFAKAQGSPCFPTATNHPVRRLSILDQILCQTKRGFIGFLSVDAAPIAMRPIGGKRMPIRRIRRRRRTTLRGSTDGGSASTAR